LLSILATGISSALADSVTLSWDASPTLGVTYRVYANGSRVADTSNLTAIVTATVVTDFYVVAVKNNLESIPSNHVTYTPAPVAPAPPSNLRAVPVTTSRIDTSWDATGFSTVLERGTSLNSFTPVAIVPPTSSYYINTGLKKNRTYYFRAKSSGGILYSNIAAATLSPH